MRSMILLLIFLFGISHLGFSQLNRCSSSGDCDNPIITIGPEGGGAILYEGNLNEEAKIHYNYNFGSFLILRPFQRFGLETGLIYGKWIKSYSYYEVPIILQIYNSSNFAFKIGPLLNFPILDDNSSNKKNNMQLGLRLGAGSQLMGFYVDYSKNRFSEETPGINNLSFMIGLGFKLRVGLINF